MAGTQVNPTRMELTRLKKKLVTAVRGHKLLKDKRDELMRQFLDKVRENKALREEVETALVSANQNFMLARAGMPDEMLNTALLAPKQELTISAGTQNVMSVEIPDFDFKTRTPDQNDMYSYGFAFTTGDLDDAILSLSEVFPKMLKLAEVEKSCQLMAAEIEKTRRRVNALEHVMIPELQTNIKYITMKLDENERSTQIRLMKVKDMMLKEAHQLLKVTPGVNFVGNIEPRDVPNGEVDVVVCDGFTGNVILKLTEGVAKMLLGMLKEMFLANLGGKIAYLLLKSGVGSLKHQMDSEEYGGAPFLGAKQPVIKAHGSSKAKGIKNAIRQAKICVENDLCGTMQSALDELTTSQAD